MADGELSKTQHSVAHPSFGVGRTNKKAEDMKEACRNRGSRSKTNKQSNEQCIRHVACCVSPGCPAYASGGIKVFH